MRVLSAFPVALALLGLCGGHVAGQAPPTRTVPVVDTLYGTPVPDPYRWLEDASDQEVGPWFEAQGVYSRAALNALPGLEAIQARLRAAEEGSPPDVSLPRQAGGHWFYTVRGPGEAVAKGYVRDAWTGEERLLVDPAAVAAGSESGSNALGLYSPSPDGKLVLYEVTTGGSEAATLRVRNVETGQDVGEPIERARWTLHRWGPDGRTFFYLQLRDLPRDAPATDFFNDVQILRHNLGDPLTADVPVFSAQMVGMNSRLLPSVYVDSRSRWAVASLNTGVTRHAAYYLGSYSTLTNGEHEWRPLFDMADSVASVAIDGPDLYALTSRGSSNSRIVRTSLAAPDLGSATDVFEDSGGALQWMSPALDGLYVGVLKNGGVGLIRIPWGGEPKDVRLPPGTSVATWRASSRRPGILFTLNSWTGSTREYRYHPSTDEFEELGLRTLGPMDVLEEARVTTVFAPSHDAVEVPLTIIHPQDFARDGSGAVVLGAYGAYGITDLPAFFRELSPWVEAGGISATCHTRGGGYYGKDWHRAGMKDTKPNTWLDLIACAEYLIREGYTTPGRVGLFGASAGGIAVGRAITERPELFGAAAIMVGIADAVRFETTPNGPPNIPEFGSVATEEGFRALLEMSPVHHVRPDTEYPAVLLATGLNDPRVSPWQPGKMAAALQAATTSSRPILLRVDGAGGHMMMESQDQFQLLIADILAFASRYLDLPLNVGPPMG